MDDQFRPRLPFKSSHVQTILGSSRLRAWGANPLLKASVPVILDAGSGVRLLGYHSKQPLTNKSLGLVVLLHGWEGSSESSYILSMGKYLFRRGFDVFRLNLRDHGESHHLNEGLFHGALIEETVSAVQTVGCLSDQKPLFLMGFSLGGNFALRIALRQRTSPVANLRHVIAVSPALDPHKSTLCIDNGNPVYRSYFMSKWKKSLRKKQALFPHRYDFRPLMHHKTCMGLTEAMMSYYPDFPDYRTYFNHYTLLGDTFSDLTIPVTVITSQDDPVVPVSDFYDLRHNDNLKLVIHPHGGHCGFLEAFPSRCWHEEKAYRIFEKYIKTPEGS